MMQPEKFAAFMLVSAITSVIPGPSMLFVMGEAIWRGGRAGAVALGGVQIGYTLWWLLAGLGLGTLAAAFPLAFHLLAIGGALYLAWLGVQALRHAGEVKGDSAAPKKRQSRQPLRDGFVVAISNPKALIYIVALLPPFVDQHSPILPQLALLAVTAMVIDIALGLLYIAAGNRLARAMARSDTRRRLDWTVGVIFICVAIAILAELFVGSRAA